MKDVISVVAAVIMLFATVPYIIDIVKGKTKPNIVTWFIWAVLVGIGAAALFAAGAIPAALLLVGDGIATFAVVLFGLKYGTAKLDLLDVVCLAGALIGLGLWLLLDSPLIAIIATLIVDVIGTIPTLRHAWSKPEEESASAFIIGIVAIVLTLISLKSYELSAWIYPVYLLASNGILVLIINRAPRIARKADLIF